MKSAHATTHALLEFPRSRGLRCFLGACLVASALPVQAGAELVPMPAPAGQPPAVSAWERFNGWSIGDFLFPDLHLHGIGGASSTDPAALASGAHDPLREAFSAQAIEPGVSLRLPYFEAFANHIFHQDAGGDWHNEWEEAFAKITDLPGGFEIKGGRFLAHFGPLNSVHLHAWDFVDAETAPARFLGEDGLLLEGGGVDWTLPFGRSTVFTSVLSLAFGNAPSHDHGHHHGHGHSKHEGEDAVPMDDILSARLVGRYRFDDFRSVTGGLSWAGGDNGFGRRSDVFGLDAEYLWRENGLEPGGRALRLRSEALWRRVNAYSEHDDDDDGIIDDIDSGRYDDWGFYAHAIYSWNERFDTSLRIGWAGGVDDFGQAERFRVSPAVTCWLDTDRRLALRTQYNYDRIDSREDEHSLWFQLSIALGCRDEVR